MRPFKVNRTVLVPVFGGDISDEAFVAARSYLKRGGSRLVLLHVAPEAEGAPGSVIPHTTPRGQPRWRRLASAAGPDHTFVEAAVGDPCDVVLDEADRFRSDVIVVGPRGSAGPARRWIDRTIDQLADAAPRRVCLATRREQPRRKPRLTAPMMAGAYH